MTYSVQLYSVRDAIEADLPGTIARLAEIGYTQVEPYNFAARAEELAAAFAEHGITAPTAHAPLLSADQDEIFAAAKRLGIGTVIDPYLPAEHWQDEATIRDTAARLNAAAKKGAEHGIRVGYHNHDWEISSTIGGTTALEFFAGLLDPGLVLEVDTYWAAVGGADPAALLARLGDRVVAIHLKDGPVDHDKKAQLPAGQGKVDIWGVIAAAKDLEVGVVEFDDYAGDIFEGVAASLRYLEAGAPSSAEATSGAAK
ncbi:xylose isomerase [Sinomonas atrocyanea]|uniref:Xylose isomerase n=1 Tax=Sinomonas atrocyanea TaxID=37927 RepID=A0A126ZVN3_9MICC|nr:sugar phosphate isomerase/epimerase [Sinomonas atrocyanea]AMM31229.1 xylose isomerase [Sinomonas atrocyanea]GEB66094.1 xylose isomerase [Sinomonas atrocyanea]GGG81705.1 xylose isomerase [Sinomonas atrocyanea]